ncbi:hypothetical protein N431DRAFT_469583 [Stipitochalara longipes BDJ]|nr:hypothetical protein N431DRAFT_469583 [Stipitochalara longipes BDJ]
MAYAIGVEGDARYGQPRELVFDGLLYAKIEMTPHIHELWLGYAATTVVSYEQRLDGNFDEFEEGPDFVVFNGAVYHKQLRVEGYTIHDQILRTVDPDDRYYQDPSPTPHASYAAAPYGLSSPTTQAESTPTPDRNFATPPQQHVIIPQTGAAAVMGTPLHFLFDLPQHQRAGVKATPPRRFNPPIKKQADGKKTRAAWATEHTIYLFDLMEKAMSLLSRPLEHGDFRAITEALHRRFRGTSSGGVRYFERGWNTVHTAVIKNKRYEELKKRVLPADRLGIRTKFPPPPRTKK